MRPPCEFVQREFLQTLRIVLAKELKNKGLSQGEISRRMNITQPAVNKYLGLSASEGPIPDAAKNLAFNLTDRIMSSSRRDDELVKEICHTCMNLRIGSHICQMHWKQVPSLGELNCRICSDLLSGKEMDFTSKAKVVSDLQEALRLIESSIHFAQIVPQVRANLVTCDIDADSVTEVAGVPGRITLINGRARALMGPQFGASTHTASMLLWAKSMWPHVRACFCISGIEKIIKTAKKHNVKIFQTKSPASNVEDIIELAKEAIGKRRSKIKFPADQVPGGIGVEPILYLFGQSAVSLSILCIKLSEQL